MKTRYRYSHARFVSPRFEAIVSCKAGLWDVFGPREQLHFRPERIGCAGCPGTLPRGLAARQMVRWHHTSGLRESVTLKFGQHPGIRY